MAVSSALTRAAVSRGSRGDVGRAGADIDFLHLRAGAGVLDRAVEQHPAFIHDGDVVGELEHPVDVVLDQQHRQIGRNALDDGADALAFRRGKACERLVQQQDARRGGERHAHVEQPLAAIGQHAGFSLFDAGKAEIADGGVGLGIDRFDRQARW